MWNLVPQLFYDILARIVPGAALTALTAIVLASPAAASHFVLSSPRADRLFSAGPIFLWVLGSYIVGFVLGQIWDMTLGRLTGSVDRRVEDKCQADCLTEYNRMQKMLERPVLDVAPGDLPRIFVMRDHLRHVMPGEAARLLKVRAERRSCQVLILGFFCLSLLNGLYLLPQPDTARMVLEAVLVIAIIACWHGAERLHRHLANGTTISWLVLVASGASPVQRNQGEQTREPS